MNKRHYEHTLPNIRGSLSNTYDGTEFQEIFRTVCSTFVTPIGNESRFRCEDALYLLSQFIHDSVI